MAFALYYGRGNSKIYFSGLKKADKAQFEVLYHDDETCDLVLTSSVTKDILEFLKNTYGFVGGDLTPGYSNYYTGCSKTLSNLSELCIFVVDKFNKTETIGFTKEHIIIRTICKYIDPKISYKASNKIADIFTQGDIRKNLQSNVIPKIKALIKLYKD